MIRSSRHHAFTLIELLVVISIIALLIGILLPALGAARDSARNVQCLSQIRQMGQAANAFAVDHKGYVQTCSSDLLWGGVPPIPAEVRGRQALWTNGDDRGRIKDWASALADYMGDGDFDTVSDKGASEAFQCPSDPYANEGYRVFNNISDSSQSQLISYAVNADVTSLSLGSTNRLAGRGFYAPGVTVFPTNGPPVSGNLDMVRDQSSTMLYAEGGTKALLAGNILRQSDVLAYTASYLYVNASGPDEESGTFEAIFKDPNMSQRMPLEANEGDRHNDRVNMAFIDGHASSVGEGAYVDVKVTPHDAGLRN